MSYRLSFIGASLLLNESVKVAEQYAQLQDWQAVEEVVFTKNLLQKNKRATAKRELQELRLRIDFLAPAQLDYFLQTTATEQRLILFWAMCHLYPILGEFTVEVVRNRWLALENDVPNLEYQWFVEQKILQHPELEALADSTRNKVRTHIFLILSEADLINNTRDRWITPPAISRSLAQLLSPLNPTGLYYFLLSNNQIQQLLKPSTADHLS